MEVVEADIATGVEVGGGVEELLVVEDVKRGFVHCLRLLIAPMPERAEDGAGAAAKLVAAGDAPDFVGVALLDDRGRSDGFLA